MYNCFHLLKTDLVMEYAWRFDAKDYAMPYLIQSTNLYMEKVERLDSKLEQMKLGNEDVLESGNVTYNEPLMLTQGAGYHMPNMISSMGTGFQEQIPTQYF